MSQRRLPTQTGRFRLHLRPFLLRTFESASRSIARIRRAVRLKSVDTEGVPVLGFRRLLVVIWDCGWSLSDPKGILGFLSLLNDSAIDLAGTVEILPSCPKRKEEMGDTE